MKKQFIALWIVMLCLLSSFSANGNETIQQAWIEINNKNYINAETILQNHLTLFPSDNEARFLYARAFAWQGNYSKAHQEIDSLLKKEAKNSDYLLTKARILSWQDKNREAIKLLNKAITYSPDYFELWQLQLTLLTRLHKNDDRHKISNYHRVFKQKFGNKVVPPLRLPTKQKKQSVLMSFQYDRLNNDNDWKSVGLEYGNMWKKYQYSLNITTHNRFNINDQQILFNATSKLYQKTWVSGGISTSTKQKFFPVFSAHGKINHSFKNNWTGSYKLTHKIYRNLTADTNHLSLSKKINNIEPKITLYLTTIDYDKVTFSTSLQLTYYMNKKSTVRFSITRGDELEYINREKVIYQVTNLSFDGKYIVNPSWNITYALTHQIQGTAYTRNGILSGLQYRF